MLARRAGISVYEHRDAIIGQHRGMKRNRLSARTSYLRRALQAAARIFSPEMSTWSGITYRAAKLALFFLGFTVFFGSSPAAHAQSAKSLFKQGENAEAREDYETAFEDYRKAFQKDPKDLRYKTAYERSCFSAAASHVKRGDK